MPSQPPVSYSELLDALHTLRWPARRAVPGALPGMHHSRLRGSAPELSEYRPYRQGDDPRRLDWKLLARSDRAYIRLADDRSVLSTTIVVDATASMAFPEPSLGKWWLACELAVGLAAVAHQGGDPVGLVVGGGAARHLSPRSRRGVVGEIARALGEIAPRGSAPLAVALDALHPRSRIALITDFLGDASDLRHAAGKIAAAGGEVHAVHVVAAEELEPPSRALLATDPEDPTIARPLVAAARDAYRVRFSAWRAQIAAEWRGEGLSYTLATTSETAARAVRRIAMSPLAGAAP
jgi:uncharacterized protein (DUF58 family)